MRHGVWPYLLLAAACGLLFFWRLGATPLMGFDEGVYAECSREMLASGDYVVPTCNGGPFFDKPPVGYWLQAASMRVFGVNSFAARLPSAIEGLVLVGLVVLLGTRLFSRRAGLLAGFALASSILAAGLARMAILDAAFTLAITASLGAFLLAYLGFWPRWSYLVFWSAMGLSVMVKGPAGAVLILATVIAFLLIRGRFFASLRMTWPAVGIVVFLAVALPWYVLIQQRSGGDFLREFLIHQNLQRALGQDFQHNMPFYFYVPIFLVGFFPWSAFVPAALFLTRKPRPHPNPLPQERGKGEDAAVIFMAVWVGVVFVVFSILRSKLPAYIFPIYPPSALLVGLLWARAMESGELASLRRSAFAAVLVACAIGGAMMVVPSRLHEPIPGLSAALLPMGLSLLVGCAGGYVLLVLKRPMPAFIALACGMAGVVTSAVSLGLPIAARTNAAPAMNIAHVIARYEQPAFAFRLSPPMPQLGFYAGRPVVRADTSSSLPSATAFLVVAQEGRREGLPPGGKVEARIGPYVLLSFARPTSSILPLPITTPTATSIACISARF